MIYLLLVSLTVLEFHLADVDGLAFLDAALLELLVDALDAPDVLEAAHSLIVVEVRHDNELLDGLAVHDEVARIIARDRDLVRVFGRLIVDLDLFLLLRLLDVVVEPFTDVGDEFLDALARRRRDGEELQALLLGQLLEARQILLRLRQVDLVGHEDLRTARDLLAVLLELCIDLVVVVDRIAAFDARGVDDVQDELRALDVAQEVVAEADAVGLDYAIDTASVTDAATCQLFDLWYTGMCGARLHAKYLKPVSDEPVPLVLQFHGYPGASRSWFEQASFAGMGMALIALDCPGQGGPSEDIGGFEGTTVAGHIVAGIDGDPANLYYVRLHQDIRILCRIVRELEGIDLSRVFVNGASQGGGLGIATCALNSELINRAAILYPFLSDFRLVWDLDADDIAYEGLRYWSRWFDEDSTRIDEAYAKLAYFDSKNFAPMVKCPVLFGTGTADIVCPPATQFAVYNNLTCEKRHEFFEGFGHEEIQDFDDLIIPFFCKGGEARV